MKAVLENPGFIGVSEHEQNFRSTHWSQFQHDLLWQLDNTLFPRAIHFQWNMYGSPEPKYVAPPASTCYSSIATFCTFCVVFSLDYT